MDAAVASLLLCSVPDQARALAELCRMLRPDGELPVLGDGPRQHPLRPPPGHKQGARGGRPGGRGRPGHRRPARRLLDEATSSLDAVSEARVTDALQRLRSGRTTIIIAHRLSTVAKADQVAVVEAGRVVEAGTPDELRARGGRFADLYGRWLAGAA